MIKGKCMNNHPTPELELAWGGRQVGNLPGREHQALVGMKTINKRASQWT